MTKDLMYWKALLEEHPLHEVVAIFDEELKQGNILDTAYGFLAVVEAMGRNDAEAVKSNLAEIMEHLYLIQLYNPSAPDYEKNLIHWEREIFAFRKNVKRVLKKEPSLIRHLTHYIEDELEDAKHCARVHLQLDAKTAPPLSDLTLEQVLPAEWIPHQKVMVHKPLVK